MAKEYYSLSWFKKRTAALNTIAGTKLSPTQLYKQQRTSPLAQSWIAEVREREEAAKMTGRRIAPPRYGKLASDRTQRDWAAFASTNYYAAGILDAYRQGGYLVSRGGEVLYREYDGKWFSIDPSTRRVSPLKGKPAGVPLTASKVNSLLDKVAKAGKTHVKEHPTENYRHFTPRNT